MERPTCVIVVGPDAGIDREHLQAMAHALQMGVEECRSALVQFGQALEKNRPTLEEFAREMGKRCPLGIDEPVYEVREKSYRKFLPKPYSFRRK